jgi:hypothetical protein
LVGTLAPVLGPLGAAALLARSCAIAKSACVDLAALTVPTDSLESASAALRLHVAGLPASAVRGATDAVVDAMLALLTKFVGERLALQLVQRAWLDPESTEESR